MFYFYVRVFKNYIKRGRLSAVPSPAPTPDEENNELFQFFLFNMCRWIFNIICFIFNMLFMLIYLKIVLYVEFRLKKNF